MKELQDKINIELYKLGDDENMMPIILEKYKTELNKYDVHSNPITCRVTLYKKGELKQVLENRKTFYKKQTQKTNFLKRVRSGSVENSIKKHIDKKYPNKLYVEHSRSFVKSESFYIVDSKTDEKLIKLSLHNTCFQEWQYETFFIDLNNFHSTIDLKKYIDEKLKEV